MKRPAAEALIDLALNFCSKILHWRSCKPKNASSCLTVSTERKRSYDPTKQDLLLQRRPWPADQYWQDQSPQLMDSTNKVASICRVPQMATRNSRGVENKDRNTQLPPCLHSQAQYVLCKSLRSSLDFPTPSRISQV